MYTFFGTYYVCYRCNTKESYRFCNFLTERQGKGGTTYNFRDAVCLETQHFPDAIHHENFPSTMLKKGETYHQVTKYTFTVNK